ncbi:MAG: hypothetical protein M1827_000757 [Pycnora praestabilis]|nr:MAG: hypothetical protein M1827_000757 [Pycnora praestabilis]
MASQISDENFVQAVLSFAQENRIPESEEVTSAELPSSALPALSKRLEKAQEVIEADLRKISRDTASDTEGWISQTKQLHADLEKSTATAADVINQTGGTRELEAVVSDAAQKVELLQGEIAFNETLGWTLEVVQKIQRRIEKVDTASADGDLIKAATTLDKAHRDLRLLSSFEGTRVYGLLKENLVELRKLLTQDLEECWKDLMIVDHEEKRITLKDSYLSDYLSGVLKHKPISSTELSTVNIDTVVGAFSLLGLLKGKIDLLYKDLDTLILAPRLVYGLDKSVAKILIHERNIEVSGRLYNTGIQGALNDLYDIIHYLNSCLPPAAFSPLSHILMPVLTARLISFWLSPSVPPDLRGMDDFQKTLTAVSNFVEKVNGELDWNGGQKLIEWIEQAPRVWLAKRRGTCLDMVRRTTSGEFGPTMIAEMVETRALSQEDTFLAEKSGEDDWNASWSDEEGEEESNTSTIKPSKVVPAKAEPKQNEEDDVSAWGLDDEGQESPEPSHSFEATREGADDDEEDQAGAWGFENVGSGSARSSPSKVGIVPKQKDSGKSNAPKERKVTLRETYTVTAIPKAILEEITCVISDAEFLAKSKNRNSPIAAAAAGLFAVPTLILAMYRATASIYYEKHLSGNMHLYNDSMWLAAKLSQYGETSAKRAESISPWVMDKFKPVEDCHVLQAFARRAYCKEMQIQRTILGDLLDGGQGFEDCTNPPFSTQCDDAVSSIVDRIRELNKQWKDVLSNSALLQSLGSLLVGVTNRFITQVEEMDSISDPQSQKLVAYCNQIINLEDLFLASGQSDSPFTVMYTANWLKFQYFSQILESSLVDINYLWTEGELSLEFTIEEVTDLIRALFEDSENRRKLINDIRRSGVGR